MGGDVTMGGYMQYGTKENGATAQLQKNMKLSWGQKQNGKYNPLPSHTAIEKQGTVMLDAGNTQVEVLQTIIGKDKQLTESDLLSMKNNPKGRITNVFELGNGIYEVEYKLPSGSENETAFMQFDFETNEERAMREAQESAKAQGKKKQPREEEQPRDNLDRSVFRLIDWFKGR